LEPFRAQIKTDILSYFANYVSRYRTRIIYNT